MPKFGNDDCYEEEDAYDPSQVQGEAFIRLQIERENREERFRVALLNELRTLNESLADVSGELTRIGDAADKVQRAAADVQRGFYAATGVKS